MIDLHGLPQVLWPIHCVQESFGAEFVEGLNVDGIDKVFQKGTDPDIDSYSGFYDNGHRKSTGLSDFLKEKGVEEVFILGLATDYCVKFTALDAIRLGYRTNVILEGCRGVNLHEGDVEKAIEEMKQQGVNIIQGKTSFKSSNG